MSDCIETFLLARLRRESARDAIDLALARGWLMETDAAQEPPPQRPQWRLGRDDDEEIYPVRSQARRLELGPKLAGLPREEIARLLARSGIALAPPLAVATAPAAGAATPGAASAGAATAGGAAASGAAASPAPGKAAPSGSGGRKVAGSTRGRRSRGAATSRRHSDRELVHDVVRAVHAAAEPPPVDAIAAALLLADGIRRCGASDDQVLAALAAPRPIVSLLCPVGGFESRFIRMLRAGLILPGSIAIAAGQDIRWGHVPFTGSTETARKVILFAGRRFDKDEAERSDQQVGQAASTGYPIITVAESEDRIPLSLRLAASLDLECRPLSAALVGRAMQEVLGPLPEDLPLDDLQADASMLTLFDLSLAIHAGTSHARAVEVLVRLGRARRREHEEGEREGTGKARSRSSSSSTSFRDRAVKGSGSEIVRPVPKQTIECDPFVPTVERLHGYGEARNWALDLKQDLQLWKEEKIEWSALSTKLLLSGPPGTGKTSFARALSNTLQLPLIATSVSTWLEASYLGDVVRRMKLAFEEAGAHAPAILFIDEIDGIGRRGQGKAYDDYWNTVVNKALELLDGAVRSSGIVIVGATNHPDVIDPALLRSGRLERHIRIPPPDIDALAGILRHHLGSDLQNVIATRPEPAHPGPRDRKAIEHGAVPDAATVVDCPTSPAPGEHEREGAGAPDRGAAREVPAKPRRGA